ncbi:dihydrodipicolinate synthase family protein [Pseudomonas monteilii]
MSSPSVLVPLVTPLDTQGNVCRQSVERLIRACSPHVDGFIPCLTSGEGWSLSTEQWSDMLRHTLACAGATHRVIVGIELATTEAVIERAALAAELGAQAIMVTSPFGGRLDQPALVAHYRAIQAASDLELLVYNEAALSGNEKSLETLLAIARLPRVTGLKDSPSAPRTQAQIDQLRQAGLAYYIGWEKDLAGEHVNDGNVVSLANLEPALCRVACQPRQPQVATQIGRLDELFSLGEDDWYAHVKRELSARGVLDCALTTQERRT